MTNTTLPADTITAEFDNAGAATAAEQALISAGVPRDAVRRYQEWDEGAGRTAPPSSSYSGTGHRTFWEWLLGEEPADTRYVTTEEDRDYYARLRHGDNVVVVDETAVADTNEVIRILRQHAPINLLERTGTGPTRTLTGNGRENVGSVNQDLSLTETGGAVRTPGASLGQTPTTTTADTRPLEADRPPGDLRRGPTGRADIAATGPETTGFETTGFETTGRETTGFETTGRETTGPAITGSETTRADIAARDRAEEVMPVVEEHVQIGTQQVETGRRRLRRVVTEHPVEREVTLHDEHVVVERRPASGEAAPGDAFAPETREVELRETTEVPVVSRDARVVEEVVVGREQSTHTETVRDTERRSDVEVVDEEGTRNRGTQTARDATTGRRTPEGA